MKKTIFVAGFAWAVVAQGATFYVDAKAAGNGDGSSAKPWNSARAAVEGVRAARKAGQVKPGEAVEVCFAPGDYFVGKGLKLTTADSGTAGAPVTWRTLGAAKARLTGGVRIPAELFRKVADPAVLARLPEAARGKVYVADVSALVPQKIPAMAEAFGGTPTAPLLFVGGRLGTLARWPNADYTSFTKAVDKGKLQRKRPDGGYVRKPGAFIYDNPRAKRWNFAEGVWMNGYWTHDWDNHSVRAARYGAENGTNDVIRLAAEIPYGVMGGTWGRKDRRFYVFNLLDELDAPGEWWLDRAKKLLYLYPPAGTPRAEDNTVLAFSSEPILKGEKVGHLRFERLAFEYGYGSGLALQGDDLQIVDCRVANLGASGMSVNGNRNCVRDTEVFNIGRSGISVSGGDRRTLTKADTRVEGCHVHDWAIFQRTYAPAIGVNGCGITLRRNKMHDAPHSAVLYGGNEHLFEYNEVYRVLMETGDAGAYYTGRDWTTMGNVLRYNNTHDLGAEGDHANTMGFYFDDCDCGDAVYGNIFHNVARGIMVGGGREHPIRNNIFSKCLIGLSIDCRGMTWKHWNSREHGGVSWLLEEKAKKFDYTNGIWAAKYPLLAKIMQDHPREPLYNPVENNIFIDCSRQLLALDGKAATECLPRMAPIAGNLVINTVGTNGVRTATPDKRIAAGFRIVNGTPEKPFDAGFVDAAKGNFALKPDAWLLKEMPAFKPLPHTGKSSMKATLDGFVDTGRIAGVVSVVSDADYAVQTDCAGWADVERRVPITDRTLFAIFSMTKSFTGIAMMCAIDEGKISLDDPVAKFLPEFANVKMKDGSRPKRALSIRDLMCHQTGFRWGHGCVNAPLPPREVARRLASEPLHFQPGETFSYGNSWISTAAACIEVAVGEPFDTYLKRRVLDPLGMVDTTFHPSPEQVTRLVKPYTSDAYALRPGADRCTPQVEFPKTAPVHPAASGGLFSTPADMIRFSQMLAHHGTWKDKVIVSRTTFDTFFAVKQTGAHIREPYTVGAWIWGDWIGHEGAMRTDQRANLKTGHSRVFFIQTENRAGPAFFQLKAVWQHVCDQIQGTKTTIFGT